MEEKNKAEKEEQVIFKSSLWNFLSIVISRIGGIIFTIILARFLMPAGFGIYSIATTIALFFMTFADLGVNKALVRYVSSEFNQNLKKSTAYFRYIFKIKLFLTLLVSVLLLILAYPISFYIVHKPGLFLPLIFLSFYIFLLSIEGFFESIFYIQKKIFYLSIKEIILQVSKILFIIIFLVIFKYSVLGAIYCLIISISIVFLYIILQLKKTSDFIFKKSTERIDKKRVFKFIKFITAGNIFSVLLLSLGILVLGVFVSDEYVGYFNAVLSIVGSLASLFCFPYLFLSVFTQTEKLERIKLAKKIFKFILIIIVPSAFGLAFLAEYTIAVLLGYGYLSATIPLRILSFSIIPIVLLELFITLLSSEEKSKEFAKLIFFVVAISLILYYFPIKLSSAISEDLAVIWAALATLFSWILYLIGAIFILKKHLKISFSFNSLIKPIICSIIMILILNFLKSQFIDINLINGLAMILSGIAVYFLSMFLFKAIRKKDLYFIRGLIKKEHSFKKYAVKSYPPPNKR